MLIKELVEDKSGKTPTFYLKNENIKIDRKLLSFLEHYSLKNQNTDVRICVHKNKNSKHHSMVLLQNKNNYYRPHKHKSKGDTFLILKGKLACFLFSKRGKIKFKCVLKKNEIFRTPNNTFHAVMPLTKKVLYFETKKGPFLKKNDSIFASWSPSIKENKSKINDYKNMLFKSINEI